MGLPSQRSAGSYLLGLRPPPSAWEDIKDLTPAGARLLDGRPPHSPQHGPAPGRGGAISPLLPSDAPLTLN